MTSIEFMALNARADASRYWPHIHFYDRAAARLGILLNIDRRLRFNPSYEQRYLRASQWLDQQCLKVFQKHPTTVGVELGAGFSTRFHRLSECHEWPRFSWVDIDNEELIRIKSSAMPRIDNYFLVANHETVADVVVNICKRNEGPLTVVVDGLSHALDAEKLNRFIGGLRSATSRKIPVVLFIVFKSNLPWYKKLLQRVDLPANFLDSQLTELDGELINLEFFGKSSRCESVIGAVMHF